MNRQLDSSLSRAIQTAWAEINQDPQHRLRIHTRLNMYDDFIADMGVSIYHLIKTGNTHFPHKTPGLKRLGYLGVLTVEPLFPAWEREMDRIAHGDPEMEPARLFPYSMLSATRQLLSGKSTSEITFDNEYWVDTSNWHYIVGNLCDDVSYDQCMFLKAVHRVYTITEGWLPFRFIHSKVVEATYDDELKTPEMENRDFTYHALQAYVSENPNESSWDQPRSLPVKRDREKALAFWQWWLFELVTQAVTADLRE